MAKTSVGFVVENVLGHASHLRYLMEAAAGDPDIEPVWMPVMGWADDCWQRLPRWVRNNWTVMSGLRARDLVSAAMSARRPPDLPYFHTQVTALLSLDTMRSVPAVLSLDATPRQIDPLGVGYAHAASRVPGVESAKAFLHRRLFASARRLVAWTPWVAESLIDDYDVPAGKVAVVPPGVDTAAWAEAAAEARAGRAGPVRLLFVGGDFPRKGGPQLLAALDRLPPGSWALDLVTYTKATGAEGRPNVRVIPGLPHGSAELRALFAAADVFVLPTLADTLGVVLIEALAAGLPVVTTRVGGLTDVVGHGVTGLLTEPGDIAGLTEALGRLAADRELRLRLGAAARADAVRRFDARSNYRRLLDLLKSVPLVRFHRNAEVRMQNDESIGRE